MQSYVFVCEVPSLLNLVSFFCPTGWGMNEWIEVFQIHLAVYGILLQLEGGCGMLWGLHLAYPDS